MFLIEIYKGYRIEKEDGFYYPRIYTEENPSDYKNMGCFSTIDEAKEEIDDFIFYQ